MARKKGILTVGVVTIPFRNQGNETMSKAIDGITELENNVDSLLIIDNEKLFDVYGDLLVQEAFPKADEVLATAVRGITEIIKKRGHINVDFKDVSTMMRNDNRSGSRYALMGCGTGTGKNRIEDAVKSALESPLLNDFDLNTAQKVLINVTTGANKDGLTMSQYGEVSEMIKKHTGNANNFKSGLVFDESPEFGDRVNITVIVTGINMNVALPQTEIGNIIMIDNNFVYERQKAASEDGINLPQVKVHKIGYNSTQVRKKLVFDKNNKPALLVTEDQSRSELENVSALRRKAQPAQNREEL
jgi:cell division protein FtsZ